MCFEKVLGLIKPCINICTLKVFLAIFFIVLIIKFIIIFYKIKKDKGLFMNVSKGKRLLKKFFYILKVLRSKICFFVKSFLHYIFCRNILLNLILILFIVITKDSLDGKLLGPFISALLTINIVNYFNYYSREINFNSNKRFVFADLREFINEYTAIFLSDARFPIHTNNRDEHKQIWANFFNYNNRLNDLLDLYENYFNKISNDDLSLDKENIQKYFSFFSKYKDKINENINIATILFPENYKNIKLLSEMKSKYDYQIVNGKQTLEENDLKSFINSVIHFIKTLKEINNYISDVWY